MAAYRWVSNRRLDSIVGRLQKATVASKASTASFDNQDVNVGKLYMH